MSDFEVEIGRTATRHITIKVQAPNREEAKIIALEQAGDHDFSNVEKEAVYEVIGCTEVAATEPEPEEVEIVRMLQAYSGHLTKMEADVLMRRKTYVPGSSGYRHIASGTYEVFIAINEDEPLQGMSMGFIKVVKYARDRGISMVRFGRDASHVPGCTRYAW